MRKREILDQTPTDDAADDNEPQRAGIQSVEVGFELLQAMSEADGPLMLRDLAAAAGMSAAKAHRYLVSFQRLGLVMQDPVSTRYDLGPAALRLGLASLARIDAVKLARERVADLLQETGAGFADRVTELRLQAARKMLADKAKDHVKVVDIAYAVGFNEVSYFNRRFRQRFGEKPSQARGIAEP